MTARRPAIRAVREQIAPFSPQGSRRTITELVVLTSIAALAEAATLVVIARTALAVADGADDVELGLGTSVGRSAAAALALAALAVKLAANARTALLSARLAAETGVHARRAVMRSYFEADWAHQSEERLGDLQDFLVTAVSQLSVVNAAYINGLASSVNLAVIVGIALVVNPVAALACAVAAGALILLLRPLTGITRRSTRAQQDQTRSLASSVTEAVRLTQEARVFGVRDGILGQLGDAAARLRAPQQRQLFMQRLAPSVYQTAALAFLVLAVVVSGELGGDDVQSLGVTVVLLLRGLGYGQQLQAALQQMASSVPYLDALHARMRRYERLRDDPGHIRLDDLRAVRFEDVGFSYRPGLDVLEGITVDLAADGAVGIVGPSGSGKSTLTQLLLRLRAPTSGAIRVDGVDLRDVAADDWARLVAFVPQDARLLHATVAENIAFFRDVDPEELERAARLAHIHDDIVSWPDGYQTHVGEMGNKVSGGQRQRIAIARALVGRPRLLVLDEPTSALDLQSEARLQATLRDLRGRLGLVIVAHRLSTITLCDRILVLRAGRVEGFDAHESLIARSPFYREALRLSAVHGGDAPDLHADPAIDLELDLDTDLDDDDDPAPAAAAARDGGAA
jgi:ATP-binding cassette, subfamily B, bacterial